MAILKIDTFVLFITCILQLLAFFTVTPKFYAQPPNWGDSDATDYRNQLEDSIVSYFVPSR